MNVYLFELRRLAKSSITWVIALCVTFWAFSFLFPTYRDAQASIAQVLSQYPPEFKAAFSINIDTMFTLNGFFSFYSMYLMLAASIMACYFGLTLFARERLAKTSEFLFAKPVSRASLFLQKLGAGLTVLSGINAIFLAFLFSMFAFLDKGEADFGVFVLLCLTLVVVQMILFSIGVALATFLPRIKTPSGIATSVAFGLFIVGMVYGIIKEEIVRYFAVFLYLDPGFVLANGHYDWPWLGLCAGVFLVAIVASGIWFLRRDIESV